MCYIINGMYIDELFVMYRIIEYKVRGIWNWLWFRSYIFLLYLFNRNVFKIWVFVILWVDNFMFINCDYYWLSVGLIFKEIG